MKTWKVAVEPQGSVGSKTVMASVSCEQGNVQLTGHAGAVALLIETLEREIPVSVAPAQPETSLIRFVFVDKDGLSSAMAFDCSTEGGYLTLHTLEQIENFASKKLGHSVLAESWEEMARGPKIELVGGEDMIGGVKADGHDAGDETDAKLK